MKQSTTIGLDLGTSVAKGVLMNESGTVLAQYQHDVRLYSPQSDWAEQKPQDWWRAISTILRELGTQHSLDGVTGIGLSGQMHGLVTYDKDLKPARPAMVWLDRRSQKEVETILEKVGHNQLYRITGNPIFTGFLLPSLLWIKNNEKSTYAQIKCISSPKDFLALQLTGNLRSEPTDAMATAAFDQRSGAWSEDIIRAVGINPSLFPEIAPTHEPYGGLLPTIAKRFGLPAGVPIFGGSDQSMGAMGLGLVKKGQAMLAVSTGGQFVVVGEHGLVDSRRRLHTLAHAIEGQSLYMAATLSAALSMRWFKEEVVDNTEDSMAAFTADATNVPIGSDGVLYHPYLAGERTPYFNSNLRASFSGLSIAHTQTHLQRSIMEGVACSQRQSLEVFEHMKLPLRSIILTGGGSKNPLWRQIIASTLGKSLHTVSIENHSPYGAAIYAQFAQRNFSGLRAFYAKNIKKKDTIRPRKSEQTAYTELYTRYEKEANRMHGAARRR